MSSSINLKKKSIENMENDERAEKSKKCIGNDVKMSQDFVV